MSNDAAVSRLEQMRVFRDRDFVVIVTAGRTGSTLLQGLLNQVDGYLIRGENFGFTQGLFNAWKSLTQARLKEGHRPTSPYFGCQELDGDQFITDAACILASQLVGSRDPSALRAIGFKEIRWFEFSGHVPNLWSHMQFIERMFPKAKFIVLTRELDEIMDSDWWREHRLTDTRNMIETFRTNAQTAPVRSKYSIDYANLADGDEVLAGLFAFLGVARPASIGSLLGVRHGTDAAVDAGLVERLYPSFDKYRQTWLRALWQMAEEEDVGVETWDYVWQDRVMAVNVFRHSSSPPPLDIRMLLQLFPEGKTFVGVAAPRKDFEQRTEAYEQCAIWAACESPTNSEQPFDDWIVLRPHDATSASIDLIDAHDPDRRARQCWDLWSRLLASAPAAD